MRGGVRPSGTTYNISDSNIWGWCALNIWTVGNTFAVTNSDLRGINVSNGISDGFAAVVVNDGIYGTDATAAPNSLVFTGGSIGGYKYGSAEEGLIRLGNQLNTRLTFALYEDWYRNDDPHRAADD